MDNNTAKLIEQLAQKLGTTSEYLWKVLLKQAPIDATIDLIFFIAVIIYGYVLFRIHKRLMQKESDDKYAKNLYEKYEPEVIIPMVIGALLFLIFFLIFFFRLGNVINGYFNPEYWALQKILSQMR